MPRGRYSILTLLLTVLYCVITFYVLLCIVMVSILDNPSFTVVSKANSTFMDSNGTVWYLLKQHRYQYHYLLSVSNPIFSCKYLWIISLFERVDIEIIDGDKMTMCSYCFVVITMCFYCSLVIKMCFHCFLVITMCFHCFLVITMCFHCFLVITMCFHCFLVDMAAEYAHAKITMCFLLFSSDNNVFPIVF